MGATARHGGVLECLAREMHCVAFGMARLHGISRVLSRLDFHFSSLRFPCPPLSGVAHSEAVRCAPRFFIARKRDGDSDTGRCAVRSL